MLCWALPYINMNWPKVYICSLPLEPSSLLHPIPPQQIVTEHWIELPASYSKFPLAINFTYGNMYVSMLLSQFSPPSPPTVSINLFSMSQSLLLFWGSLYILDINPFLGIEFANIFSYSVGCLLSLLIISFAVQKFL